MKTYAVGGSVRDQMQGLPASDMDYVVVGATEREMLAAGFKPAGAFFPVFLHPETGDEYALARKEKKSGVGHTAFTVEFDPNVTLTEDLARRDLTINAMALTSDNILVDPFRGMKDLENKVLRHVSSAFAEDPLRVVRLARFYARFSDFTVADETVLLAQSVVLSGEMDTLSVERFWAEMDKMFRTCEKPDRFFAALWNFQALTNVKFFKELLGPVYSVVDLHRFVKAAQVATLAAPDFRLTAFVAMVAPVDAKLFGTTVDTQKLHQALWTMRSLPKMRSQWTGEMVAKLLKRFGAVSQTSKTLENLVKLLSLGWSKMGSPMMPSELVALANTAHTVRASEEMFEDLEGPALGEAMLKERIRRMDEWELANA